MTNTNLLTKEAIKYLNLNGFNCWRNNNGAVYSVTRKTYLKNPLHKLGVPDIIGYRKKDGRAVFIEVKTGKDKLSEHQINFIDEALRSNCISFVIRNIDELINTITLIKSKI